MSVFVIHYPCEPYDWVRVSGAPLPVRRWMDLHLGPLNYEAQWETGFSDMSMVAESGSAAKVAIFRDILPAVR